MEWDKKWIHGGKVILTIAKTSDSRCPTDLLSVMPWTC